VPERPLILVTNDDGVDSDGILSLAEGVAPLGDIWVVAPDRNQSAMSHALTLATPLRVKRHSEQVFACSGTPTDCVFMGVLHLLPRQPDLVVSGINHGPNLGDDVSYSGTVSAALEAAIMGIPGIAFSHVGLARNDFRDCEVFARQISERVLREGLPKKTYLNVNVPDVPRGDVTGVEVTTLGHRFYEDSIVEAKDPRGKPYYWIGGSGYDFTDIPGSDCTAVHEGRISITALQCDPTHREGLDMLRGWGIERS
jgi:5'-nucleotidase